MTGAPIKGVTAFNGITPISPGRLQKILHNKAIPDPHMSVPGKSMRWFVVLKNILEICGTARPIKATGPQKAVTTAVRIPVSKRRIF